MTTAMSQCGTKALIDAWRALPHRNGLPSRRDFRPAVLGTHLNRAFSLRRHAQAWVGGATGGWIEALFGSDLARDGVFSAWRPQDRAQVSRALELCLEDMRPWVLTGRHPLLCGPMTVTVVPFRCADGRADRLIGVYAPVHNADRDAKDLGPLTFVHSASIDPIAPARPTLVAIDGRRVA